MASLNEFVELDWRRSSFEAVSNRDLSASLSKLIFDLDQSGCLPIVPSRCQNQKFVRTHKDEDGRPVMWRYKRFVRKKHLQTDIRMIKKPQTKYTAWATDMIILIQTKVMSHIVYERRHFFYEVQQKAFGLKNEVVKEIFDDIALTIGVHPFRLGAIPEARSQIFVPEQCQLTLKVVGNIFDYYDKGTLSTVMVNRGRKQPLPVMIESLEVSQETSVRAVVVTEHRNLTSALSMFQGTGALPGTHGIMVVMTGGFPDLSVREFLHLLSDELPETPFLWLSDCDSHGIAEWLACRNGSATSAWASPSMVCPRLQFVGLTTDMLDAVADSHADRKLARIRALANRDSNDVLETKHRAWKRWAAARKAAILSHASSNSENEAQQKRLLAIRRGDLLVKQPDSVAQQVFDHLQDGNAPLPLACVDTIEPFGIVFVVRDAVASVLGETSVFRDNVPLIFEQDSLRADFAGLLGGEARDEDELLEADEEYEMALINDFDL
ncbi:hypothetical protein LTS08_008148 [Lithohypha guttulata]|nr:hypothetical protein LTS08_008148 [Lithohypha guttulata]